MFLCTTNRDSSKTLKTRYRKQQRTLDWQYLLMLIANIMIKIMCHLIKGPCPSVKWRIVPACARLRQLPPVRRHFWRCHRAQYAAIKQIIRREFFLCQTSFTVFWKNGTKEEEADEAVVLVSFWTDNKLLRWWRLEANKRKARANLPVQWSMWKLTSASQVEDIYALKSTRTLLVIVALIHISKTHGEHRSMREFDWCVNIYGPCITVAMLANLASRALVYDQADWTLVSLPSDWFVTGIVLLAENR